MAHILLKTLPVRATLVAFATFGLIACDSQSATSAPSGEAAPAASAAGTQDWTATVTETPEGGFLMGSPDAKVKLVEFASLTCSHCKDFHLTASETIKNYVRSGQISYEYRPFMLNVQDMAGILMATCEGPQRFFTWADQMYRNYDAWLMPFTKLTQADIEPLKSLPPERQILGLAEAGGMQEFAKVRGLPRAKFEACLTDNAAIETRTQHQQSAIDKYNVSGTPTFLINGRKLDGVNNWAALQPALKDALR